jgi:uncharacterized protein (TIGR00106 family)
VWDPPCYSQSAELDQKPPWNTPGQKKAPGIAVRNDRPQIVNRSDIWNCRQNLFENRLIGGSFMLADFAVVPMGVTGGVKALVAEALKIVDESGLSYKLGAMHTTIEGDSDRVMDVILRCHRRMLELAPRVLTSITIDDRRGATGRLEGKVRDVEQVLGKPLSRV